MKPWQEIPLADYEAHMNADAVNQASALSELFGEALALRKPSSVAVLGVAGGNGLERIDGRLTRRVVGMDLNPHYLTAVRERFANMPGLELHAIDLVEKAIELPPVELVHAALIFEHTGLGQCLENALALITPEGALSVVLQLPGTGSQNVGSSGVASITKLAAHFSLIDPNALTRTLEERGLRLTHERLEPVPGDKRLWMGIYARS
jgi:hypothetical protein